MDIKKLEILMKDLKITFDGISDMGDVVGRFLSYVLNTVRSRLVSILKYVGSDTLGQTLTPLVNQILLTLSQTDEIKLFDDLYLQGGISREFEIVKGEHVKLPLDISIIQENVPFVYKNEADLASVKIDDKWQL
jgi:hypothetical protein